jgi:putative DNA primase/helicase
MDDERRPPRRRSQPTPADRSRPIGSGGWSVSAFHRIPAELRELPQWVNWRLETREGRLTKVPYRATEPSVRASSTDPRTWATFEQAVAASNQADGIGFVFTAGDPYCGIDLDLELPDTERASIALALSSYTEESVSGGWHVILRASLNGHGRHPQGIGIFDSGRYFVVTGRHVTGTPATIEERQTELEAVLAEFMPKPLQGANTESVPAASPSRGFQPGPEFSDRIDKMFDSKSGRKIGRLFEGDWSAYPSQSEADLALLTHFAFWFDRDAARMQQMFRASGLYRDEGPGKPKGIGYLARTIEMAITGTSETYSRGLRQPIPESESVSESVGETRSSPALEGSRDAPIPPIPRIGESVRESVAVAAPSVGPVELVFQPAPEFATEDEPNAEMILGLDDDDAAFVAGGTVVEFGKGGGGKTTLINDIACHLATGADWHGLKVPKRRVVAIVENDGPRGRFRRKVRAKLDAWTGSDPGDNLQILAKPWGQLRLSLEEHRAALAAYINANDVEVLIAGPIVSLGMIGGGTPDEVAAFEAHLQALRDLCERPLLVILLHHTNQRGQISGAWDRVPDTLIFVVNTGKGTRLTWQKARDSSTLHATTWKLKWAAGMAFELDDTPDVTEVDIEEGILAAAQANPGGSWTVVSKSVTGNATTKAAVRDRLIDEERLMNRGKGQAFALWHPDDVDLDDDGDALPSVEVGRPRKQQELDRLEEAFAPVREELDQRLRNQS